MDVKDKSGPYDDKMRFGQYNLSGSVGYEGILSPNLLLHASWTYTAFKNAMEASYASYRNGSDTLQTSNFSNSYIYDNAANIRLDYQTPNNVHHIKTGVKSGWYRLQPGFMGYSESVNPDIPSVDTAFGIAIAQRVHELTLFAENDIYFSPDFTVNIGIRASRFADSVSTFLLPEPRLAMRWLVNEHFSIKTGYTLMHQFLHVLENNVMGFGSEIWLASNAKLAPQTAHQISAGVFGQFEKSGIEYGIEGYYKRMNHLLHYQYLEVDGDAVTHWEDLVYKNGKGESYGAEFWFQRQGKRLYTSLAYTLSWSNRQFDDFNYGRVFPFTYDRRHDVSLLAQYMKNERNEFGFNWVFSSGTPTTLPEGFVPINQFFWSYYGYQGYNNMRLPPYHRLDIYWKRNKKTRNGRDAYWSFNIYNAYFSLAPVYLYPSNGKIKQVTMFPILPTINWGIKF